MNKYKTASWSNAISQNAKNDVLCFLFYVDYISLSGINKLQTTYLPLKHFHKGAQKFNLTCKETSIYVPDTMKGVVGDSG